MNKHDYKWPMRLIGIAVLVIILMKIDRHAMARVFQNADWLLVIASALLFGFHLVIKAVRWNYILVCRGIRVSQFQTLKAFYSGALLGTVTPGRIGEFSRAAFIRGWNPSASWGTALGTILFDRMIDLMAFALVALWGVVWIGLPGEYRIMGELAVLLLLAAGISGSLIIWRSIYQSSAGESIRAFLRRKIGPDAADFYQVFKLLKGRGSLRVFAWTILAYVLFYLHFLLLARAMGSMLPAGILCWGIAVASLGVALPVSISGMGIRDFILIAIFTAWGEPPARTLAISLSYLAIIFTVIPAVGIWPLLRGDMKIKRSGTGSIPVR